MNKVMCALVGLTCLQKLMDLADAAELKTKIKAMYAGEHINSTEDRAVLHVATRARREQVGAGGPWLQCGLPHLAVHCRLPAGSHICWAAPGGLQASREACNSCR